MHAQPPLPPAAAAEESEPFIPPGHKAEADRAQGMVDRIEAGDKSAAALTAARALREECLASGNLRSAEFLAGHIVAGFPEQLEDHHRFVEILLARGKVDRAEKDLRSLVAERPTDCGSTRMLSGLLLERGRPADAMEVHAAHLREHPGEARALYARASIALWDLREPAAARAEAAALRTAADRPGVRKDTADWLRANATAVEEGAVQKEKEREILGAASRRLDRVLWGTVLGAVLALATAGWLTRPKP